MGHSESRCAPSGPTRPRPWPCLTHAWPRPKWDRVMRARNAPWARLGPISEPAARTVGHEQVMAFVDLHLTDPGLDVAAIGRGCRISRRRVHRLLADAWGGPMTLVRQ